MKKYKSVLIVILILLINYVAFKLITDWIVLTVILGICGIFTIWGLILTKRMGSSSLFKTEIKIGLSNTLDFLVILFILWLLSKQITWIILIILICLSKLKNLLRRGHGKKG